MGSSGQDEAGHVSLSDMQVGDIRKGIVVDIQDFGVFVDMGGVEGLVPLLEISWKKFSHPADVVGVGQEVTVLLLSVDVDRGRVTLSLKALDRDPMLEFAQRKLGATLPGRVTNVNPIGIFVQVDDQIEGLIVVQGPGISDASGGALKEGDDVMVTVLGVNVHKRQVSLSSHHERR